MICKQKVYIREVRHFRKAFRNKKVKARMAHIHVSEILEMEEVFMQRSAELKVRLIKRGYPPGLVQKAIDKAARTPRQEALVYANRTNQTSRIPFVITHNPTHPPLGQWLRELLPTLHTSRRMRKAIPDPPIVGERRCRNLRSLLMPSRPPPVREATSLEPAGCRQCTSKRCVVCKEHLKETTHFSSIRTGQVFKIRHSLTCTSSSIVYLIDCARCADAQYVGETGQPLKKRIYGHRSSIKSDTNRAGESYRAETLVAKHFQGGVHSLADMRVQIIEQCHSLSPHTHGKSGKGYGATNCKLITQRGSMCGTDPPLPCNAV